MLDVLDGQPHRGGGHRKLRGRRPRPGNRDGFAREHAGEAATTVAHEAINGTAAVSLRAVFGELRRTVLGQLDVASTSRGVAMNCGERGHPVGHAANSASVEGPQRLERLQEGVNRRAFAHEQQPPLFAPHENLAVGCSPFGLLGH